MADASIIELRSTKHMQVGEQGHAITFLPDGAKPGMRESAVREDDAGLDWYLARVAGRREHKAEAALIEAGLAVYLPRTTRKRRKGPDKIRVEEALFGGYLFAGVVAGRQTIGNIEGADELVYRVVRFSGASIPRPIPFRIIAAIHDQELAGEFDATHSHRKADPDPGAKVNIIGGMWQGFPAKFVGRDDADRVKVLMKVIGSARETPYTLDPEQVEGFEAAA
jgi:transcription antitermination factor NusG